MKKNRTLLYGSLLDENVPPSTATSDAILRGKYNGNSIDIPLSHDVLSKHTLFVGGTGSGKSTLFYHFVRQLKAGMTANDVMLIFDSKGDFHSKFFDGSKDMLIGNSNQYRKQSERWNLYREIIADGHDRTSVGLNTQEICKALFADRVERNTSNAFFPNAARDLLASLMIALNRNAPYNNDELLEYIQKTPKDIRHELIVHPDLAAVANYIDDRGSPQTQGVFSELFSVVREIFTGVFASAGVFSIREFIRDKGGRALFIEYDLALGSVLAPVYSLMFDLALKEALGRQKSNGNVFLIADELKLMPNLQHLEDGINFGRSLGLKIMAGLQSIGQLEAVYAKDAKAKNIIAGFGSLYAFRSPDPDTREYVSRQFGRNMLQESFQSSDGKYTSETRQGCVVEDWDLTSLQVGEAIIGLPFDKPFRFQFDDYLD